MVQQGIADVQADADANKTDIATNTADIATNAANIPVQLWAVIGADATVARASDPQATAGKIDSQTGRYEVVFGVDVSGCSYTSTAGDIGEETESDRIVTVASRASNPNGVFIETTDTNGTQVDADFHLQVLC